MKRRMSLRAVAEAFAIVLAETPRVQRPAALAACAQFLRRSRLLPKASQILEMLDDVFLFRTGVRRAAVSSADPLSAAEAAQLERALHDLVHTPVTIRVTVRPELLAGFRAEVGDTLVDASLRGSLSRLRAQLRSRGIQTFSHA